MTGAVTTQARLFIDLRVGDHHTEAWVEVDEDASPQETADAIALVVAAVNQGDDPLTMTVELDEREDPCPECRTGEVVNAGRMEWETGHQPYACNANCGYNG